MTAPRTHPRVDLLHHDFVLAGLVELRHQVQRRAQDAGLADLALYRFVVAVNEITTNAVRHGGGAGRLELWRTGRSLYCRVTDHGPGLPPGHQLRRPTTDAVGGRGLWLAGRSSDHLAIDTGPHGTSVTLTATTA